MARNFLLKFGISRTKRILDYKNLDVIGNYGAGINKSIDIQYCRWKFSLKVGEASKQRFVGRKDLRARVVTTDRIRQNNLIKTYKQNTDLFIFVRNKKGY